MSRRRLQPTRGLAFRPPVEPLHEAGALLLDKSVARPGDRLHLTIENRGETDLEFGLAFHLERWATIRPIPLGIWKRVPLDLHFVLIAYGVVAGDSWAQAIPLPSDLKPGWYRVVKEFIARGANLKLELGAQFEIR